MNKAPQPDPATASPAATAAATPIRVPTPTDPDMMSARKKKMMETFGKKMGRDATNLSADTGPNYSRTTLG